MIILHLNRFYSFFFTYNTSICIVPHIICRDRRRLERDKKNEHEKGCRVFVNNSHLGSGGVIWRGSDIYYILHYTGYRD